ncbi:DNA methyltransferase [Mucilaginibacter sp. X5P1]|uniref:DNA methyltransferase n=1 Tax=Mucilaginibacter sp. X5P1 TaxID=2723088 RepID=UPI001611CD53|nr:DNA methyltransferase [Mucilaginibacter sp. X5P1]MBB6139889.1 DNA modification methylase [Mucilaginibacter sp. X5P1]
MIDVSKVLKGFSTAEARWARYGPYYAMFPVDFAFEVIETYTKPGEYVLDPFAGRSSSVYAGGVLGRPSLGIEINPVGWLYGTVKLQPADKEDVIDRLMDIYNGRDHFADEAHAMPEFFQLCFCHEVLKFLLAAREGLNWRENETDATLMSIILVYLHGKLGEGLSNQLRQTKSMAPNYSVNWWKSKNMVIPPEINPLSFLLSKIKWRYDKGKPDVHNSNVVFGDSAEELQHIVRRASDNDIKFSLLFTSPPYCSVTDYHADQWLRLWALGGAEGPYTMREKHKGRFVSKDDYYSLLDNVFGLCSTVMAEQSTIYVRTDKRKFTFDSTLEILTRHYPDHMVTVLDKPLAKDTKTQTQLFGDKSLKPGEVDIILSR